MQNIIQQLWLEAKETQFWTTRLNQSMKQEQLF